MAKGVLETYIAIRFVKTARQRRYQQYFANVIELEDSAVFPLMPLDMNTDSSTLILFIPIANYQIQDNRRYHAITQEVNVFPSVLGCVLRS